MKLLFTFFILLTGTTIPQFDYEILQEGDFIFQDLDCGPLCDAIEKVTEGINGLEFSHVGVVVKDTADNLAVLEAISSGVQLTNIEKFLSRSVRKDGKNIFAVGRLKKEFQQLIPEFIKQAKKFIGQPYDNVYRIDNESYYCSELIYLAAKKANNNYDFFKLNKMTFKDPDTDEFYPAWIDYYKNLNTEIPEGEEGINPGIISLSEKIEIIFINN